MATTQAPPNADLKYASGEERRFALAFLRQLAGGDERRQRVPYGNAYGLTAERESQIRANVEAMILDAHPRLVQRMRESLADGQ